MDARIAGMHGIGIRRSERAQQHLAFLVDEGPRRDLRDDRGVFGAEVEHFRDRRLFRWRLRLVHGPQPWSRPLPWSELYRARSGIL